MRYTSPRTHSPTTGLVNDSSSDVDDDAAVLSLISPAVVERRHCGNWEGNRGSGGLLNDSDDDGNDDVLVQSSTSSEVVQWHSDAMLCGREGNRRSGGLLNESNDGGDVLVQSSTSSAVERRHGGTGGNDVTMSSHGGGGNDVTMTSSRRQRLSPSSWSMPKALAPRRLDDVTKSCPTTGSWRSI